MDWLCLPRFDSGSCFAKLIGDDNHGRWLIAPEAAVTASTRSYQARTMVLQTDWSTAEGTVRVIDFMPPCHEHSRVVRLVCGLEGRVRIRSELVIRFEYGLDIPWVRRTGRGLHASRGTECAVPRQPCPIRGAQSAQPSEFHCRRRRASAAGAQLAPLRR